MGAGESDIPKTLDTEPFRKAWAQWVQHRREIKHALKPTTYNRQLASLARLGERGAIAAIDRSITNGWTGLFPEKERPPAPPPRSPEGPAGPQRDYQGDIIDPDKYDRVKINFSLPLKEQINDIRRQQGKTAAG